MKAIKLTVLAACLLVGGLAVAGTPGGSTSQFSGGVVMNMGLNGFVRGIRCGLTSGAVLCSIPTANTCICRSATFPVFRGGVQVGLVSVCVQRGNCP